MKTIRLYTIDKKMGGNPTWDHNVGRFSILIQPTAIECNYGSKVKYVPHTTYWLLNGVVIHGVVIHGVTHRQFNLNI